MRLLVIDPAGNGLDLAWRAQDYGHEVKHFIRKTPKTEHIGKGFVEIVPEFKPWLRWADLVFHTDNTFYLQDLDSFRREMPRTPVIGPSSEMAQWELDRGVGDRMFRKHGIETPHCQEFNNYDKAVAFVKQEMRRFVSKPSGDADKALSYCSTGPDDMVFMLERWQRLGKLKAPFLLQEYVDGMEMAVGAWCGPNGFVDGFCENFEFKKLCNGDLGVATGEQGTVLRYTSSSKLAKKVLIPFEQTLVRAGYTGYIDVNCIIDEHGQPWPLEFTVRPGWPTFNIQEPLHEEDPVLWLTALAKGEDPKVFTHDLLSLGVVLSVPDYPYSHLTRKEVVGIPIYGIMPTMVDHIHPCEIMMGKAPRQRGDRLETELMWQTAGDYVLVMTGTGSNIQDIRSSVYRRLKHFKIPNSPMYRTDIGVRLKRHLPKLQKMGYATGIEFSLSQNS
jgi:phosphoribosylamine---glycine ligase